MKSFLYTVATDRIEGGWVRILKFILLCVSYLYSTVVQCILVLYKMGLLRKKRLPKPVICVGNITLGGSGKTPLVMYMAKVLQKKGLKPVILIRGYMAQAGDSDEAKLLQKVLKDVPVLVGKNRFAKAQEFLRNHDADVFICDDAFQHWRLFRDLDVVVVDAVNAFGNKYVLPRGILREPLSSLQRAHVFVLTKTDLEGADIQGIQNILQKFQAKAPIIETQHQPVCLYDLVTDEKMDLEKIKGKDIGIFCSIGNPESFQKTLDKLGANILKHFQFVDHYVYKKEDIEEIVRYCREHHIDTMITTEKDTVKLMHFLDIFKGIQVLCLQIEIHIVRGKDEIGKIIHSIV